MVTNVCRLCLSKDNLVWIFDKRFQNSENMKDVIFITTGVEITIKDIISQKICKKCCEVTIKMFEFRKTSLANNILLREQTLQYLREKIKIPKTEVTISSVAKTKSVAKKKPKKEKSQEPAVFKVHPSVRDLFKVYPQIKLPTVCLKSHITPIVSLKLDQVENYFKRRKLDINEYTKLALQSQKIAAKKTSTPIPKASSNVTASKIKIAPVPSECKNKQKIPPIRIIQNNVSESRVVNKVDEKDNKKDPTPEKLQQEEQAQQDKQPQQDHQLQQDKQPHQDKKRKFDEVEPSPSQDNFKKPAFIESLGLTPTISGVNGNGFNTSFEAPFLAYVANKSVPLHICDICNSVQYSAKELKKHMFKHLRCQFCKSRFRTLDSKRQHIQDFCIIKKMMHNLPDVELEKVEYNVELRQKYPSTFLDFLPSSTTDLADIEQQTSDKEITMEQHPMDNQGPDVVDPVVIEILSDDEDSPSTSGINKENVYNNNVPRHKVTPKNVTKIKVDGTSNSTATSTNTTDNVPYTTVSVVKPDIRIRDSTLIDRLDPRLSDTKILKELLSNKPPRPLEDKTVQTILPTNTSICINRNDSTIELRQLKPQLYVYKIPVAIKFGPLRVTYNYDVEPKQQKKMCLWNDLMPIDIRPNKTIANGAVSNVESKSSTAGRSRLKISNAGVVSTVSNSLKCSSSVQKGSSASPLSVNVSNPVQKGPTTTGGSGIAAILNLPSPNRTSSPKFIRVNKSALISPPNIIDMNPLLNKFLLTTTTTSTTCTSTTTSSTSVSTAATTVDATVSSSSGSVGSIRVKNVWELT